MFQTVNSSEREQENKYSSRLSADFLMFPLGFLVITFMLETYLPLGTKDIFR
jgi:hypothetical protein